MTYPEGPDVNDNTRKNNNIVWRNVNVVNLESGTSGDTPPIIVRNTFEYPTQIDLQIRLGDTPSNLVRSRGRVVLHLGELYKPWQENGGRGRGIQEIGEESVEVLDTPDAIAELYGIPLDPKQESDVSFTITAPETIYVPATRADEAPLRFCSQEGGLEIPDDDPPGRSG